MVVIEATPGVCGWLLRRLFSPASLESAVNSISQSSDDGWSVNAGDEPGSVVLSGEIDFSVAPRVRERLMECLRAGAPEVVVHLAGLDYVDSSGLALLIEARKRLLEAGRTIRIADISPQVRKIFNLTQLGELFGLPE